MAAGSRTVELDEGPIAFELEGAGPPLVLLHGALGDSRDWHPQLDGLSDEFTVVAWDAPGCGGSFDPPGDFGMSGYADTLAGFVHGLELERPHILGLSFGGALAIELFGRHRDLPRSLVLASAYAGWAGSLPREVVAERLAWAMSAADRPPEQAALEFSRTLFVESVPPEVVNEVVAIMSDARPAGTRAMAVALAGADLRPVLPLIDVPTLLLYGDADQRSPLPVAKELRASIESSHLVVIPGIGHMTNIEAPERFNDEVRRFLRSVG